MTTDKERPKSEKGVRQFKQIVQVRTTIVESVADSVGLLVNIKAIFLSGLLLLTTPSVQAVDPPPNPENSIPPSPARV